MDEPGALVGVAMGLAMIVWRRPFSELFPGPFARSDEGQARSYAVFGVGAIVFSILVAFGVIG